MLFCSSSAYLGDIISLYCNSSWSISLASIVLPVHHAATAFWNKSAYVPG
jgi:hypothetical protein